MNLPHLTFADVIDIALVAVMIYALLAVIRQTRTHFVAAGVVILGLLYVIAFAAGLRLTVFLFQIFFTVFLIALIVIFQGEMRTFFARSAAWLFSLRERKPQTAPLDAMIDSLASTVFDLAKDRVGALIILQGKDDVLRHTHGGHLLNGDVSEPLLKSLFDPHSIGHDGALIVVGRRAVRFGCHLPLSTDARQLNRRGTRHAAALGAAENTDALCIVVSEERGEVSIAEVGKLERIADVNELDRRICMFYTRIAPRQKSSIVRTVIAGDTAWKLASLLAAAVMWFIFVHESIVEYRSFTVPVQHTGVPSGLAVTSIDPPRVKLIVSAPRRRFYFADRDDFPITVKLFDVTTGTTDLLVTASDVALPGGITFVNLSPNRVRLEVATPAAASPPEP